jgi:O-antigen ligase
LHACDARARGGVARSHRHWVRLLHLRATVSTAALREETVLPPTLPPSLPPAWSTVSAGRKGRGWDLLLLCLSGFILTSVGRIHQLFPALAVFRPVTVMGILAIGLCLLDRVPPRRIHALQIPATRWLLALVVWMALSVPGALWPGGAFGTFRDFAKTALIYFVIVTAVRSVRDIERLALVYVLGAVVFAVMVLTHNQFQLDLGGRMERLYFYDSNDFATYTVTALPLGLYFAMTGRPWLRIAACAAIGVLATGFIWSGSRGGFLALLAVVGYFLLRYTSVKRSWRWTAVTVIAVLLTAVAGNTYWARISTVLHPSADYNLTDEQGRLRIWGRGMGYMIQHPVFGVGGGNFPRAEGTISPLVARQPLGRGLKWGPPHNSYLQVGAELGVPGLIIYVAFILGVFAALRALPTAPGPPPPGVADPTGRRPFERARLAQSLAASLIGFAVGSFFLTLAYHDILYTLAGMAVGLRQVTVNALYPRLPHTARWV